MGAIPVTETDLRITLDLHARLGNVRAVAKQLGLGKTTISERLKMARIRGIVPTDSINSVLHGYSPDHNLHHPIPEPFIASGHSTLYKDGKPVLQWVKSRIDDRKLAELTRIAIAALAEEVSGKSNLIDPPEHGNDDLLAVYPLGDPHIGMRAWQQETGENFDLKEAERVTLAAVDRLVQSAPAASTAIILPLGDVFHMDDQTNQTPSSKHALDVDSRYVKVLEVGIKKFRHAVERALEKHQTVVVRFVQGNHDPHSVWALAFTIHAYFSNNERVIVDLSPSKFWYYRFGNVLIGSTHGDTVKQENLPGVMAADRARDWGETTYRYWYTGTFTTSAF